MKTVNVILSGGIGSRLWPLSRAGRPKQFLKLFGGRSLLELTVERNAPLADAVMVVGNRKHTEWSTEALQSLDREKQFVVESEPRNTAAAIAFAAFAAGDDSILLVTPSDHMIGGTEAYTSAVKEAVRLASEGFIATFGIVPERPETGYGYIEYSGEDVLSFREKPSREQAAQFIRDGNFLWNSGMFCFRAGVLLAELKRYRPDVYEAAYAAWQESENGVLDSEMSLNIPSVSIDYAVMEQSAIMKVVPSHFRWNDLGSFETLYDYLKSEGHPVDAAGNMVIGGNQHPAFVGVRDTILVLTDDAVLVLKKDCAQDIREVYVYNDIQERHPELV